MKKVLTIFLCSFMIFSAYSQIADYDISTFVRPELFRATWSINFSLNLENENNNIDSNDDTDYGIRLDGFFSNNKFINNEEHQKNISNFINFDGSSNTGLRATEQDFLSLSFGRIYSDRKFRINNKFIEFGYNLRAQGDAYSRPLDNENSLKLDLEVPIFLGKGRIEIVNDAWKALRILESLEKSGFLIKDMSNEDIEQLALEIGNILNSRMTDSRLESIYEFELLSKYMVEQGIINPENYAVFATLNDAWRFENFTTIRSGKDFKYGLVPSVTYNANSSNNNLNFTLYELAARIAREVYKPIRKNVQFNYSYGLDVAIRRYDGHSENSISFDDYFVRPNISASTSYYPSARTNYTIGFASSYFYSIGIENSSDFNNMFAAISGSYVFYASPQLTFNLSGNFNLNRNSSEFQKTFVNSNQIRFSTNYRFF